MTPADDDRAFPAPAPDSLAPDLVRRLLVEFMAQTADHVIIVLDRAGRVVGWLGASERVLGYSADEMMGEPISRLFDSADRARSADSFELEIARSVGTALDDRWHVRKDGTRIWVTGSVSALRDADGSLLGYVKLFRDRTDLRAQVETLENRLRTLSARDASRHQLLVTLGHEIRNPLSAIQSAGTLVARSPRAEDRLHAAQVIERQSAVLKRLAQDLLDVARIEGRKLQLELREVELNALLRDCIGGFESTAADRGVDLVALLPPAPIAITVDPDRLQQVVSNLIHNAIKYTPAGGTVWVKAMEESRKAVIRIEDTGVGIAPDMLPRIFDLFTQETRSSGLASGGLGIGLALVKEYVELHGGVVEARSAGEGKGSEFTVRLPIGLAEPGVILPDRSGPPAE